MKNTVADNFYPFAFTLTGIKSTLTRQKSSKLSATANYKYNITTTILYFVRSGYIYIHVGYLGLVGAHGNWWTSSATFKHYSGSNISSAYYFGVFVSSGYPSAGPDYRFIAFPFRDLVIVGEN